MHDIFICNILLIDLFLIDGKFRVCFTKFAAPKSIKSPIKFSFRMHVGEDQTKFEKMAKNQEVFGIMNYADLLRSSMDFFLEKQEFLQTKNSDLFRVNIIIIN